MKPPEWQTEGIPLTWYLCWKQKSNFFGHMSLTTMTQQNWTPCFYSQKYSKNVTQVFREVANLNFSFISEYLRGDSPRGSQGYLCKRECMGRLRISKAKDHDPIERNIKYILCWTLASPLVLVPLALIKHSLKYLDIRAIGRTTQHSWGFR